MSDRIVFDDGAAYDSMMGVWSRLVGDVFLDWVAPPAGLAWLDVGCGTGAFTSQIAERCAPSDIHGVDPSDAQLAYARSRPGLPRAAFRHGDAMALPFDDDSFDAAAMALVIHFIPEPARAVAETARVTRPGGIVATYVWDYPAHGSPMTPIRTEMSAMGVSAPMPPSGAATTIESLGSLWSKAGLVELETREIEVARRFDDFEAFWKNTVQVAGLGARIARLPSPDAERLKAATRSRMAADADGSVTARARANAIKGRVPA